ncbi:response regulator transcription factor [Kaistia hirudinis]|nr:response regulator transcription factor [Kaistia hirudinis]
MRILLIEDDAMIAKALLQALHDAGMSGDWARDGQLGAEAVAARDHALVLLDLSLPHGSGIDILRGARAAGNTVPVIVITARDELEDRIAGLDLGADDYLTKPFEIKELLARIRAVLRRHGGHADSVIRNGDIELDTASRELSYRGDIQPLSAREFAIMRALLDRPGTILSRGQLEEKVYGWGEEVESNAIDVLIYYIRRKFAKEIINNVRGAGWSVPKAGR